ncbi:MAG: type VI secretion protein VasK, partial [Cupriavidus sp.]|nr:type VI secretion protein VasK [Cupriavidus sp.]
MFNKLGLQPKRRGSALMILALLIAASMFIWVEGQSLALAQPAQRWKAQSLVLSLVLLLILVRGVVDAVTSRLVKREFDREHQLAAPEASASADAVAERDEFADLRDELRATYGYRWRYRQPWLLLTGDSAAIQRLLPAIAGRGWLRTDNAILLWRGSSENGQPDAAWLKHVCKLRRRRPIDAVVLVTDGDKDLPTQRRGADALGIRLARITELLRWSAPIYALEVGPTSASSIGDAPVVFYGMPRHANARSVEAALQNLRCELSRRSLAQLPQTGQE